MRPKKSKLILLVLCIIVASGFFVSSKIYAQEQAGPQVWGESGEVQGYVEGTGLSKQDPRLTVVKIIRIVLGFLGIIAVILVMYAGYLWMTAGGESDQISRAKKLLINAVIGLIIILSSFAIASFVLSKLIGATGGGDGGGGNGGGGDMGGGLVSCVDPYMAQSSYCQTEECKQELAATPHVCRLSPVSGSKGAYITISGYHFDAFGENSKIKFGNIEAEIVSCPGNNQKNWTDNRIIIKVPEIELGLYPISVVNKSGKVNKVENQKTFTVTDEKVSPGIACILPGEGKENTDIVIYGDNFGDNPSKIIFKDNVEAAAKKWAKTQIDTNVPQGALTGDVLVRVIKTEMAGEEIISDELESNGYPFKVTCSSGTECSLTKCCSNLLCVSGNKCKGGEGESCDLGNNKCSDEKCNEGLYCAECICKKLPGLGEACADGCSLEGKCGIGLLCDENCKCIQSINPVIESIKPQDDAKVPNGAPGNFITLQGKNFGSVKKVFEDHLSKVDFKAGAVVFLGNPSDEEDDVFALFPAEINPLCDNTWENNQIIVVIPDGAKDGPIKVIAENGLSDRTDDGNGLKIFDFDVNTKAMPGLCAAYKLVGDTRLSEGKFKEQIILAGIGLINIDNKGDIFFGDEKNAFNPYTGPNEISSEKKNIYVEGIGIPDLNAGVTSVYVVDGNEKSNPVNFKILSSSAMPQISGFEPGNGHSGDYVTIFGSGFGKEQGQVFLNFSEKKEASYLFPEECLSSIWKDNQILVKVPAGINSDSGTITVKTKNNLEAESNKNFYAGDYCSKDNSPCPADKNCGVNGVCITGVKPGLCKIDPVNGHEGTKVNFFGENFGSTQGKSKFSVKSGAGITNTTRWDNGSNTKADAASSTAPTGLVPGLVKIINAQDIQSNGLQFGVMNCVINGKADDAKCTGDKMVCCPSNSYFEGSCMEQGKCGSEVTGPTDYAWSFSTEAPSDDLICGKIKDENSCATNQSPVCCWDEKSEGDKCRRGGTCGKLMPLVLEKCAYSKEQVTCVSNAGVPSPSPWSGHETGYACADSVIRAEFNVKMNKTTIDNSSVIIKECKCNAGQDCEFKDTTCSSNVAGALSVDDSGFEFIPNGNLSSNKWHKVILKGNASGIKSQDGIILDGDKDSKEGGDYEWNFKTRADEKPCELGCVAVTPDEYTAQDKDAVKYNGNVTAKENACLFLNRSFSWNWSTSEDAKSEEMKKAKICANGEGECLCCVDNIKTSQNECGKTNWACVKPIQETGATPVNVMGKINDTQEGDLGKLYIDFEDFKVIETMPSAGCDAACLNASVGAVFNNSANAQTINAHNSKVYKCYDKSCLSYSLIVQGGNLSEDERSINFGVIALEKSAYYRIVLKGGKDGIRNIKGGELSGLNYNTAGENLIADYSFEKKGASDWQITNGNTENGKVYVGNFSLMLGPDGSAENFVSKPILKANKKYQLSGWIYNSIEEGQASLNLKIGESGCMAKTSVKQTNEWEEVTCEYVPTKDEEANVSINFAGAGYIWADDVELNNISGDYDAFSWTFKTADTECSINEVSIDPPEAIVDKIGASAEYVAVPRGAPDRCGPNGQILSALSYDWDWQPRNNSSIEISSYPSCGNGIIEKGEACDDGNTSNGDSCSDKCIFEGSKACSDPSDKNCCGNKIIEIGEACDSSEGCDEKCLHKGANAYYGSYCGDGKLSKGEDCDDGNKNSGDGCGSVCLCEGTVKTKIGPYQTVKALEGPIPPATELSVDVSAKEKESKKEGKAKFKLICGYKYGGEDDEKCGSGMGVGINGCCYERPKVLYPNKNLQDFCRNGVFEVIFSQIMDGKQLRDADILKRNFSGESCSENMSLNESQATGTSVKNYEVIVKLGKLKTFSMSLIKSFINIFIDNSLLSLGRVPRIFSIGINSSAYNGNMLLSQSFKKVAGVLGAAFKSAYAVFCQVKQKITSWAVKQDDAEHTSAMIEPQNLLNPKEGYQLDFNGLKNIYGVAVKDSPLISITTGDQICLIDHVDVKINYTSPLANTTDDIFLCAGRNDCGAVTQTTKDDDASSDLAGNQHLYTAQAIDKTGTYLAADYIWADEDPDNAVELKNDGLDGEFQKWVEVKSTQEAEVVLKIGAYNHFLQDDHANAAVDIKIFMCQNPWPGIESFPYGDDQYNFSTYYCRDSSNINDLQDDLPNIGGNPPVPICSEKGPSCKGDILKEYLWVEEK